MKRLNSTQSATSKTSKASSKNFRIKSGARRASNARRKKKAERKQNRKIDDLTNRLFSKLEEAKIDDDTHKKEFMDLVDEEISNDPFGMDAAMGSRNRPGQRNYRDLALYGKKMVYEKGGEEVVKKAHKQIKEEKKQKILKKKMKVLREMKEKDKDGTFMTGAGLHLEDIEIEDEDNIPGFDPLLEDKGELDDIMEEIKRDIFKMKNGEEDDLAEVRRLLNEVGTGMRQHGPPMFEISDRLKGINSTLKGMGRGLDPSLFQGIDEDTDYIQKKKYEQFLPGDQVTIEATMRPVRIKGKKY